MLSEECLVASLARRTWLTDGLLKPIVGPYINYLLGRHYADTTIRAYLKSLAHFSFWAKAEGIELVDIGESLINKFIRVHLPSCTCPEPRACYVSNARTSLRKLVVVLRQDGYVCSDHNPAISTPTILELKQFKRYLFDTCGYAETMVVCRLKHVSNFLEEHFGDRPVDILRITSSDIERCMTDYAKRWRKASLGVIRSSLKSYLRFRALQGDKIQHLLAALPELADWSHATLPKALSDSELDRFEHAFDLTQQIGLRDYAIARCLIDLGLRGHEVAQLVLESFDWRGGILAVANCKGRRMVQLPLPWQTGKAIADYLRDGRPATSSRALFVVHKAPVGKPLSVDGIRAAMKYAFKRCGLDKQFCNTHVLRHTLALRLQRSGASLKEIADVLGHKSYETTTRYARVNMEELRAVTLPWPGRQS
jgi:integrase/recombinase XerD